MHKLKWFILVGVASIILGGCGSTTTQKKEEVQQEAAVQITAEEQQETQEATEEVKQETAATEPPQPAEAKQPAASSNKTAAPAVKSSTSPAAPSAPAPQPAPQPSTQPSTPAAPVAPPQPETKKQADTVTISIQGDGNTILKGTEAEVQSNDTVLKVLSRIAKEKGIQIEIGAGGYVEGIDNLYEKDRGATSGWMYRVNGKFAKVGAGSYAVKKGDRIEWLYTKDSGKDIGG